MLQTLIAGFLVLHGLITTAIGFGGAATPAGPGMPNPGWLSWWPAPLGRSWLLDALHLGAGAAVAGGLLWIAAGLILVAAGLGLFGVPVLHGALQMLALTGAGLGLLALALYFHPYYVLGTLINLAILVLVSGALRPAQQLGG